MPVKFSMSDEAKIAWVAGFYEGEGTFTNRKKTYKNRRGEVCERLTVHPIISVSQAYEEPLERCMEYTGLGHILGPYLSPKSTPPGCWRWIVGKKEEVWLLVDLISPYLSARRLEQIRHVSEEVCRHPIR